MAKKYFNTTGHSYWNGAKKFNYKIKATGAGKNTDRLRGPDGAGTGDWLFAKGETNLGMGNMKAETGETIHLRNTRKLEPLLTPGSFSQFQKIFRRRNKIMADQLAEKTAEVLEKQVRSGSRAIGKRAAVSTGRLKRVILNPENRWHDQVGFGVGSPQFMDRSEAKYWRAIEQGTHHFVGMRIYGLWGGRLTGGMGGSGQFGSYPLAGAPFSGFRKGENGRLRPMGRKRAYQLMRRVQGMNAKRAKAAVGLGWGEIVNPIQSHRYFHEAWLEYGTPQKAREALRDACAEVGIRLSM